VHVGLIANIVRAGLYAIHAKGKGSQVRADTLNAIQKKYSEKINFYRRVQ
jgi:hypothetical protein